MIMETEKFYNFNEWKNRAEKLGYNVHEDGAMFSCDYSANLYKYDENDDEQRTVMGYWTGQYGNIGSYNSGFLNVPIKVKKERKSKKR